MSLLHCVYDLSQVSLGKELGVIKRNVSKYLYKKVQKPCNYNENTFNGVNKVFQKT